MAMTNPPPTPVAPERLFDEYHALRADPAATRAAYDALSKKVRAAKAAWAKLGEDARVRQCTDVQMYLRQFRPPAAELLTASTLAHEVAALRKRSKTTPSTKLRAAVQKLLRRLNETRSVLEREPDHDSDHDAFVTAEEELMDLAREFGVDLELE
jgi:hypothetical protein